MGIVGCGNISNIHGRAAEKIRDTVRFVSCCDIRENAARRWAQTFGAEGVHTDFEEMIRRDRLDAVLLATWPNQHREQIERALAAGARNILCEKALALTGREAFEIWQMAGEAGAFVVEGFMYRHHPAIRRVEALVAGGAVGSVDNVRACFSNFDPERESPADSNRDWRQRRRQIQAHDPQLQG